MKKFAAKSGILLHKIAITDTVMMKDIRKKNSDDNLPLKSFRTYYSQVFLDECLHKLAVTCANKFTK